MNKIIIVAVFIFWSGISFFYANSLINKNVVNNNNQFQNNTQNTNTEPTTLADELASHNTRSDCWLAIDGKIYDVTSYISSHPGGVNEIVKYCGKDGTKAFSTKDQFIPQDHSASAYAMLADFYIGDMYTVKSSAESTPESNNPDSQNNTNPAPVSYTLTRALVAEHNTPSDCWVTGNNNVFDVTAYIRLHPGGERNITDYCGKDIQAAFESQGHSANASNIFASYKIGTLGSTVSESSSAPINNITQNNAAPLPTNPTPTETINYTLTQALVAEHNTPSDCWVTGNNNVFDVTAYIRLHPGGERNITDYCGKDIQAAFDSQGHSANASNIFASYKIGTLGSTVSDTNINPSPPPSQNTGEYDDDDDDEWNDD